MSSSFNGQILVEKLAKLNNSQQSIETLSHWCIFHRNNARQVVETWDRQFRCAPRDQRVSFLYLANDILQNSRRRGLEFINEFWRVLPGALNDVLEHGGEFGRNTVLRLVGIWEERKVFGSRGQILKEELLGRNLENRNKNGKGISYKLKQPSGELLEKLISSYGHAHNVDEDALFGKCQTAISFVDKVEKDFDSGNTSESAIVADMQVQHGILKECIEQLKAAETSRTTLLSHLREALHEQELKIETVRNELQAVQSRYEKAGNICQQQLNCNIRQSPPEQIPKESLSALSDAPPGFIPSNIGIGDKALSTPLRYTQEAPLANNHSSRTEEEYRKTAAAAVAAKLAASTSSAQVLSYVLSSLASEGVIGQTVKEQYPSDNKRPKLDIDVPSFKPPLQSQPPSQTQPPPPPYPHPDMLHQPPPPPSPSPPTSQLSPAVQPPPPPPTSLPPVPPPPPPTTAQLMQTAAGPMTGVPFGYGSAPPLPSYPMVGMPPYLSAPNPYHGFQASDGVGGLFSQPPLPTAPPPMTQQ
ncbi:regulation of nuclear pre-mRNA domain-containing protein 1A-like [Phoenix dactylifera]|uniref:Regulation of nuclear pre-mRNA domain-containing protein 1A-like n=1 Tax=Phoenix dactylifera TaxID=42345 RepID=A0A8B7C367_PHODC|nr:regulation of nuclear pre-mRNA domain-containing protein 1A-like [Phoenix dactylifera]